MKIHCEICAIRDPVTDFMRPGDHSVMATANGVYLPLKGAMFGSPNPERGVPAPFPSAQDWKDMICPRCRRVPFMFLPEDLDRYNKQGGPDKIFTDEGWKRLYVRADYPSDDDTVWYIAPDDIDEDGQKEMVVAESEMSGIPGKEVADKCPKCGKLETEFKSKSGFVNHIRFCKKGE